MRYLKLLSIFLLACYVTITWSHPVKAEPVELEVTIEVIKADRTSGLVDQELQSLKDELGSLLNYTGFTMLKKSELHLKADDTEKVTLPDQKTLEVQFMGLDNNQARVMVRIEENEAETFRTTLLLVNKGSILIGGPTYENGVLLLRIGGQY